MLLFFCGPLLAQQASIAGKIMNEKAEPMAGVSVVVLGNTSGVTSNDSGRFVINVRSGRAIALVFSYAGYQTQQLRFLLNPGEQENIFVRMEPGRSELTPVEVTSKKDRREAGLVSINPKFITQNPSPITGVESMIKVLVGSNNELSSQYNVRGGSYDENLIYVNDFEVFKPYLIRNGQQEGLSFINPELVRNVNFYNGGFQARYGDKMSSVLDVQYKKPTAFKGSAYVGLLEQGLHAEGTAAKSKVTYLLGVRNRNLRNLLSAQETKGNYQPSSNDLQAVISYAPNKKWQLDMVGNLSSTRFDLEPQESQQTTSVFTSQFAANLGLDIFFTGKEVDKYNTRMLGLSATHQVNDKLKLKGMLSYFNNKEAENINIAGSYLFGERDFDKASSTFGLIANPLGAGVFLNYARNELDVQVLNATLKGSYDKGQHYWQFGHSVERNTITDALNEFEYQDSAGYSLPNNAGPLLVFRNLKGDATIEAWRMNGYVQDNIAFKKNNGLNLQAGLRYNYNNLNNELLLSPRVGVSYTPLQWKRDVIFKGSAGLYHQPPFYREMRRPDGSVNTDLKAQRSWQVSGGLDYAFKMMQRPFRLSAEAYYKNMWNVVTYDIDNVRLRYAGENNAKAYAYGVEGRLFGELVKDAESWLSVGFMKSMENIDGDFYHDYYNRNGELITANTQDQVATDSTRMDVGWLRRPTDRRINIGLFFSDYLTTNKNFRVHTQLLYGSNLPYNIPGSVRYRNALEIPSYFRVDMGFSYLLVGGDKSLRRSHDPFRNIESMLLSLEVFNLLDRANTISYALIKDFDNNSFAIPNRLTPRLVNIKLTVRW
ncbi:TonB-dependent receptor [Phnomibacter ginsenosidimutans]|uniref:TonB-dependent receptor n=1 Tax=Phnomibacter ginsenosidimutans TaxID=2676868 RepID=UPI001FED25FE|nr:carboxypeptidase-like regulatory domain-containing protein [Phnomibacter ginsenosidimutans]